MNNLALVTAPTTDPMTVSELKEHLRIVAADGDNDKYLYDIQKSAVEQLQGEAEYQVMEATYNLILSDFPDSVINLPIVPVSSIESITYYTSATETATLSQNTDFYFVKTDRSAKLYPVDSWPSVYDRPDSVTIQFKAGVALPENVKTNVLQALRLLVGSYHENRQSVVVGPNVQEVPQSYYSIIDKIKRYTF